MQQTVACAMPLWNDGSCRWCCVVEHFATPDRPPERLRAYMQQKLPQLRYRAGKARIYAE